MGIFMPKKSEKQHSNKILPSGARGSGSYASPCISLFTSWAGSNHKWSKYKNTDTQYHMNRNTITHNCRQITRKPRCRKENARCRSVLFGLNFADNFYNKFRSSQASKARLQSFKRTDTKQNLTQNGHSRSFKVTWFGVSGKAIRD